MQNGTGCAYTIVQQNSEITYGQIKLNDEATVYQAELMAIEVAAERLADLGIKGRINFHSDSLSALQTLKQDHITSKQAMRTVQALNNLGKSKQTRIKLFWVKAHVGVKINERADELAKDAISNGIPQHVERSRAFLRNKYRNAMHAKWETQWASKPNDYKRTRVWFPCRNPTASKVLLKQSREQLSSLIQWITGFCNLMRHRHKKNKVIMDLCRLCKEEPETPEHLSYECPRLVQLRTECFKTHIDRAPWSVSSLLKFINNPTIKTLMTDETNYRM
jgi:ribonuclease HI